MRHKKNYAALYKKAPKDKKGAISGMVLHEIFTVAMENLKAAGQDIPLIIKALNQSNAKWKAFARKCKISNIDGFDDIVKTKAPEVYEAWKEYNAIHNMSVEKLVPIEKLDADIMKLEHKLARIDKEQDPQKYSKLEKQLQKIRQKRKYIAKFNQLVKIVVH
jgi:vacuolar-type H+-ATPase catalytic subunit A/Vma1